MNQVKSSRQETYLLSATQLWGINSNEKAFDSTFFGVLDDALGNVPILVDVSACILMECPIFKKKHLQLEKLDLLLSSCIYNLIKRA